MPIGACHAWVSISTLAALIVVSSGLYPVRWLSWAYVGQSPAPSTEYEVPSIEWFGSLRTWYFVIQDEGRDTTRAQTMRAHSETTNRLMDMRTSLKLYRFRLS